jgi:hypothetical protein
MPPSISHYTSREPSYQSSIHRVPLAIGSIDEKSQICETPRLIDEDTNEVYDPESEAAGPAKRPMVLTHSFMVGLAMILVVVVEVFCVGTVSFCQRSRLGVVINVRP